MQYILTARRVSPIQLNYSHLTLMLRKPNGLDEECLSKIGMVLLLLQI
jgi:hypothetical protein